MWGGWLDGFINACHIVLRVRQLSTTCGGTYVLDDPLPPARQNRSASADAPPQFHLVQTPNYPNIPHAFTECLWTVIGPHGQTLRIDFLGSFELVTTEPCTQELVELRDGASAGAPVIGTFCDQMPSTQHTTSNVVRLRYLTQAKLPKNGFQARVSVDSCGGAYREPEGYIESAMSGASGRAWSCDYRIHSRPGTTLNITFLSLETGYDWSSINDEDRNCSHVNHVAVYRTLAPGDSDDDDTGGLMPIDQFCFFRQPEASIITQANEVLIRLVVNGAVPHQSNHFRLHYNTSQERCGGELNADAGFIQTPGYPVGRSNRQFCEWRITVPKGRRVRVDIVDFDLAATQQATTTIVTGATPVVQRSYFQRVNFYNDLTYGSRIRTMTGNDRPDTVYSSDNQMLINMWSRSNVGHRGFRLNYTSYEPTSCGGSLDSEVSGTLSAPVNSTSYACLYQRNASRAFFDGAAGGNGTVGTMALDIRTVEAMMVRGVCSVGLALPLKVGLPQGWTLVRHHFRVHVSVSQSFPTTPPDHSHPFKTATNTHRSDFDFCIATISFLISQRYLHE